MRRLRRPIVRTTVPVIAAVVAAGLAACASGGGTTSAASNPDLARVDAGRSGPPTYLRIAPDDRGVESDLAVSADRAYAALLAVYTELGLPANTAVPAERVLGANGLQVRSVAKRPLSSFLTCGTSPTGGPLADSYAVTLSVLSRVAPRGDAASLLDTRVDATARPSGASGAPIRCESKGALEALIEQATLRGAKGG